SAASVAAQSTSRPRIAVLDLGNGGFGVQAADALHAALSAENQLLLLDRDQSRAAARGIGYTGSLNMTLSEARDLGAAIGCDFFVTGIAETLRRSASDRPIYYESCASILLVSARSGRLVGWQRPSFEASTPAAAERPLRSALVETNARQWFVQRVIQAGAFERDERARVVESGVPIIEEVPEDESRARGLQNPRPYRRLRPAYPDSAARAEAEATIDALADIDEKGEVGQIRIVRWGGFGLDEATEQTIRQLHFYPAMRDGKPVPMRVLLRYNFRKPPPDAKH
ncbi:MAG: energy transducer TonB, partial [Pyrinomonadaceae bacterium]